jgi:deoxyinosine 3'endonuclease (endonuclease V)
LIFFTGGVGVPFLATVETKCKLAFLIGTHHHRQVGIANHRIVAPWPWTPPTVGIAIERVFQKKFFILFEGTPINEMLYLL